jgi:hypothetical protein
MKGWVQRTVGSVAGQWDPVRFEQPFDGMSGILHEYAQNPANEATELAGTFAAPRRVQHLNYAVQAKIRLVGYYPSNPATPDQYAVDGFGIFIRSNSPVDLSGHTPGLMGGVVRIAAPNPNVPSDTSSDYSYAGFTRVNSSLRPYSGFARFKPKIGAWDTYRLEVRGNQITLMIDNMEAAQRTTNAAFLGTKVGLFSVGSTIDVADFKVTKL